LPTDAAASWRARVVVDGAILGGRPVIAGTRVPVHVIVGAMAGGMSDAGVCDEYGVTPEDVRAALAYAADAVADEAIVVAR